MFDVSFDNDILCCNSGFMISLLYCLTFYMHDMVDMFISTHHSIKLGAQNNISLADQQSADYLSHRGPAHTAR